MSEREREREREIEKEKEMREDEGEGTGKSEGASECLKSVGAGDGRENERSRRGARQG